MSFCAVLKYGLSDFVAALMDPEMTLIGTSEYTMYLFETLPARKIARYSSASAAIATHSARPASLIEPTRYRPRGSNVIRVFQISHTGKAPRKMAYGAI